MVVGLDRLCTSHKVSLYYPVFSIVDEEIRHYELLYRPVHMLLLRPSVFDQAKFIGNAVVLHMPLNFIVSWRSVSDDNSPCILLLLAHPLQNLIVVE